MLNSANMTEAGPLSMLSEDEEDSDDGAADVKLPGVSKGRCGNDAPQQPIKFHNILQVTLVLVRQSRRLE